MMRTEQEIKEMLVIKEIALKQWSNEDPIYTSIANQIETLKWVLNQDNNMR